MTLDPAEWVARRQRAERAIRIAARDLLSAHGTSFVSIELVPDDTRGVIAVGERALARTTGIGAGDLSDEAVQQLARAMTRLGVSTNYRPDAFRADFEGQVLALCRALHAAMDEAWAIPSVQDSVAVFDGADD